MLRRSFIQACGLSAAAMTFPKVKARVLEASAGVTPRGSAENLVIVFLRGGPSHLDTFDLKVGSWTPDDFGPVTFGNLFMPEGLFPNLVKHTDKFSLLRCLSGDEAVHDRARYVFETSHSFNPVFSREHPHIGSLMAMELSSQRREGDILPSFLAMNSTVQGPGMLPSAHAAFTFESEQGLTGLEHPGGEALFHKRYRSLLALDGGDRLAGSSSGNAITDFHDFYTLGEGLMYQPDVQEIFSLTDAELERYGATPTGAGCAIAVKALARDRGTRVVQVSQNGWDSHYNIYDHNAGDSIYALTAELDPALAAMLEDLAAKPGKRGGTLLDETMVVTIGEFGRTPGPLTGNLGRDHFPYAFSALVAGGGIVPNQAFGATDPDGSFVTDPFWSHNRYITVQDLIATLYSSLGIDWTTEIRDTPSGRVYEYTPKVNGEAGYYKDIEGMFA